ncbi:MAG: hypothetical protein M3367_01090 [Acidobacteriota bacterium]|nr:hypothetical protein [Acidobacteriota bacterium]
MPNLQASSVEIFLREFAKAQGVSEEKKIVSMWDGAPAHRSQSKVPEGIEIVSFPAYTTHTRRHSSVVALCQRIVKSNGIYTACDGDDVTCNC